jgi:integrase
MAQFTKRGTKWLARVRKNGIEKAQTFLTKAQAVAWAQNLEVEIDKGKRGIVPDKTVKQMVERYMDDDLPSKRGERPERHRLNRLLDDDLAKVRLAVVNQSHISEWRDRRLKAVGPASVLREWNSISAIFTLAQKEWKWLAEHPMKGVTKPKDPLPRSRRISEDEIERLMLAFGYDYDEKPVTQMARIGAALLFAIETAMREGEICSLTWDHVHFDRRVVHLPKTKNGHIRDVPLSKEAIRILKQLDIVELEPVFQLTADSVSVLFAKARTRALIENLHFHDSRREALTRMAAKVDVLTLAKISGHRDLSILKDVYYTPDIGEIASKLD